MAGIPQVITEDRASGAQFIDGSLKFDGNYLSRTPSSNGNRQTWTWSAWVKRANDSTTNTTLFSADGGGGVDFVTIRFEGNDLRIDTQGNGQSRVQVTTSALFRDTGWYHIVIALDTTQGSGDDRCKIYVNSKLQDVNNTLGLNANFAINESLSHELGRRADGNNNPFYGSMSQVYLIDGLQLGPEEFGYTDPLTNTWRPKKYTGIFNAAAIPATTYASASDGKPFVNTTNEGQTLGSGYVSGATTNAILLVPGYNLTEEGSANSISNNNATSTTNSKWYGNAIQFGTAASAGNVQKCLSYSSALGLSGASNFTFEAWVYPRAGSNGYNMLFEGDWQSNHGILFRLTSAYKPELQLGNGGFQTFTSDLTLTPDQWSHVAIVCDNNTMRFFVNGAMDVKGTRTLNYTVGNGYRYIGAYRDSNHYGAPRSPFYGYMQDIRLTSDVKYNASFTVPGGGAVPAGVNGFYLPLDGNSPIGKDQSGGGNDWEPVIFGGSNSIEKATGALPILNTTQGGTQATVGNFGSNVSKVIAVTVSNASGSNKYYFDSVLNPTLPLIRGSIISFDTSDSSNNSHPFKLSSTNADSSGGTEYTDGVSYFVNGSQKNASDYVSQYSSHSSGFRGIKWTVPHDVSTTYYYCTSHTGMGNNGRLNSTTDVTKADPFAWKCFLALPLNVPSKDQSSTLNRTSSGKAITVSGCVASSVQSNFYGHSTFFDGSNDQLSVEAHGQMDFGANDDWTFEVWFYTTTVSSSWAISDYSGNNSATGSPGGQIYFSSSSGAGLHWYQNSTRLAEIPKEEIQANKWHHVAFVKDGTANTITSFLDGVVKTTSSFNDSSGSTSNGLIIGQQGGGTWFSGYMSDFRVYKGIKKYTNNFIPASTNPDILPDTPSGITGKTNLAKITDGAVTFDGSGDYLSTPVSSSDFTFGTGDFTIEMFLYNRETGGKGFIQFSDSSGGLKNTSSGVVTIHKDGGQNGVFRAYAKNSSTAFSTPVPYKRWCHVALTRESGTIKLFVDGKQDVTTISSDTTNYATTYVAIGGYYDTNYLSDCTISNVRVNKGTALYTSDFIPPTRALTNVTNTKLLCCQSNTEPGRAAVSPSISGINDGINWSHYVTGDIDSSNPAWRAFRNDTSSVGCRTQTAGGATIVWQPPSPIAFTSSFKIWAARDGTHSGTSFTVTHAGGTTDFTSSVVTSTTQTAVDLAQISGVTSPISKITIVSGGPNPRFSGIEVDSVMLVDPLSPRGNSAATNFNSFTDDINTIRGQETGYATFNHINKNGGATLSNGNLKIQTVSNVWKNTPTTVGMKTGKFYCEFGPNLWRDNNNHCQPGVRAMGLGNTFEMGATNYTSFYHYTGTSFFNGQGGAGTAFGAAWNDNEHNIIGVAFDADTRKVWYSKNGVWQGNGNPSAGTNEAGTINLYDDGTYAFCLGTHGNGGLPNGGAEANFGQKPFKFSPPDGFQPLNISNVQPENVIARPDQYMKATTYTGDGSTSGRHINIGFRPDLIWLKSRGSGNHGLYDSVRGPDKRLQSDGAVAEDTVVFPGASNFGFDFGSETYYNGSSTNYVAWTWKAGGDKNTFNIDDVGYANASDVNMNAGALNSTVYNQSQNWTNLITFNAGDWNGNGTAPFDNNSSNSDYGNTTRANGGYATLDISSLTGSRVISVTSEQTEVTITHDGGTTTYTPPDTNRRTHTFAAVNNPTSIKFDGLNSNSVFVLVGVSVDGKRLINSNITPTNIPSIAATGSSVGTKQGFSIVSYTGAGGGTESIPHGLKQSPDFVIIKNRDGGTSGSAGGWWSIYHDGFPHNHMYGFNNTSPADSAWNNHGQITGTTSSVVQVANGDHSSANNWWTHSNGADYIMYSWHNVPGLQKFGSYTGNASADGPFIELGFRPSVIIIKRSDGGAENWTLWDAARNPHNVMGKQLYPNLSNSEADAGTNSSYGILDFVSNGVKIRGTHSSFNTSNTFIYMAWAEAPSVNLYGAQANAR